MTTEQLLPKASQIIHETKSMPVDERVQIVNVMLRSLHQANPELDQLWITTSRRRLDELRVGTVSGISGHSNLARLQLRFPNDNDFRSESNPS